MQIFVWTSICLFYCIVLFVCLEESGIDEKVLDAKNKSADNQFASRNAFQFIFDASNCQYIVVGTTFSK